MAFGKRINEKGKLMLYVLATPIGNLGDISERARRILADADIIIAENPVHSMKILEHLGIGEKKFVQFAEHNEHSALPKVVEILKMSDAVLMSDAGTPGISDPGFRVVRAAIAENINVIPIPGPSAAIAALCASGLPTDKFVFLGFLPKTEIKLNKELEKIEQLEATAIFYESPHRVLKTLGFIKKCWPQAHLALARELTKIHEEFLRGTAEKIELELKKRPAIKGEFTILINFK